MIEIPYTPRPLQRAIHNSLRRFNVLVCHRRFGKTVLCVNEIIKRAVMGEGPKDRRYAYIAPLYKQAKATAWDFMKRYTAPIPDRQVNESELRIDLANGSRMRLFGADDPDALRGIYLDGVVLDEYADMSPRMWGEVIRPALADRKGWAIFIGTPKGRNQFWQMYEQARDDQAWFAALYKASETGVIDAEELALARKQMEPDEYDQEFECSFLAAIKGAIYGRLINDLEAQGRITHVEWQPDVPVQTSWDLGFTDQTAIWFFQVVPGAVHFIDYHEDTGKTVAEYAKVLQSKPYVYGDHWVPHDARARSLGSGGKSVIEQFHALNVKMRLVKQHTVSDRIQAGRTLLRRVYADKDRCALGLEALRQYQYEWDDQRRVFKTSPLHNWASHGADSFGYGAIGYKELNPAPFRSVEAELQRLPTLGEIGAAHDREMRGFERRIA